MLKLIEIQLSLKDLYIELGEDDNALRSVFHTSVYYDPIVRELYRKL